MAISVLVQSSLFALSAGILSHLCIFIRGEWHMQAPNIVRAYGFLCTSTLVVGAYKEEGHPAKGVLKASWYVALYLFGLLASICVYRVYFHRLRGFHGPFLAGVSKLWHAYHCLPAKNHLLLDRLYTDYGPIIRTGKQLSGHLLLKCWRCIEGPNELTIVDPGASHLMNGAGNKCTKAVWYDFLLPEIAINSTRDKLAHDQRRRIWDQAFTPKGKRFSMWICYANIF